MKGKKSRTAIVALLVCTTLLPAACNFWAVPETGGTTHARSALNRKDVLALWHLTDNHRVPESE